MQDTYPDAYLVLRQLELSNNQDIWSAYNLFLHGSISIWLFHNAVPLMH